MFETTLVQAEPLSIPVVKSQHLPNRAMKGGFTPSEMYPTAVVVLVQGVAEFLHHPRFSALGTVLKPRTRGTSLDSICIATHPSGNASICLSFIVSRQRIFLSTANGSAITRPRRRHSHNQCLP